MTWIDHETDSSYVGPCGSCWQWPCPLSFPVYEFIGAGVTLDMMVIVQSTHIGTALGVQWEER